ncbi:MAG: hypothetical protein JWQ01_3676 [Massilia sp.]|nr:hypothetical protein [Massilia sp.]
MRKLLPPLLAAIVLGFASTAHAAVTNHTTTLSGANESPPNTSPGTGNVTLLVNDTANSMTLHVDFSGLAYPSTASHIHCCTAAPGTAGVATMVPSFPGFPLNVTSGTYDMTFDLLSASTYNPAFITAAGGTVALAEAELINGIRAGEAYLNIHSTVYPAGEIRGFLVAAPIPEPGNLAMWLAGVAALAGASRWRARSQYQAAGHA